MAFVRPLSPDALSAPCTLDHVAFTTTDDLEDGIEFVGQERPIAAIELGVSIDREGYNIFALGPSGTGKYTVIQRFVERRAAAEAPPDDWCYVSNFEESSMPRALRLPRGIGKQLKHDMERLVEDLRTGLSSTFESEEYTTRRRALEEEFQEREEASLSELQERARGRGMAMVRTPAGFAFAPTKDAGILPPDEFQKLPEEERKRIQAEIESLEEELQKALMQVPRWQREYRTRLRELNNDVTGLVVNDLLDDVLAKYGELPDVAAYLEAVRHSIGDHLEDFLEVTEQKPVEGAAPSQPAIDSLKQSPALRRYLVNVLVDSSDATGAPVIYESNPSYLNLVGRVEQRAVMGALFTDFTLIKPGVLHRANGGYLIIDALKVLSSPYAWEGLKRALEFHQIRIESPVQMLSMTSTVSLEPEPIPLDVRVILMGDRRLYYLLAEADPDFNELFKIAADFDDEFVRDDDTTRQYAQLIATMVREQKLLPFDRSAVCRVIEHAARMVGDSERVTARMRAVMDLLEEADHWARRDGTAVVNATDVQEAIDARIYRSDRVRALMQDETLRGTILIDTAGAKVGQINGLSVLGMGTYSFGRPSRITASVHLGKGDVVDIEREVELSGPLHSKGVLILSGFLRGRYAQEQPLSLGASLVFEQSYGGVDGDSASSTELYALLSAIAGVPIKQSLAVTGSVNQSGEVQAIGGVNEKIEGFFDLCAARGLTGEQGVLIPAANVKHLMLRRDVVDAVAAGRFAVYPIATIDEGIEMLTGVPAGERGADGRYPEGTVNRMVADRLAEMAEKSRAVEEAGEAKPGAAAQSRERRGGGHVGMSDEVEPAPAERIVVALDASPQSAVALRAAVELAALLDAEVEGLFVEDVTLLYLCELQSCREIGSRTALISRIDAAGMERQLRVQATTIRETMRLVVAQSPVPWSFRVLRGAVVDELLAAAEGAAVMSMGRTGRVRRKGMGSTARTLAGRARRPLLISGEGGGLEYPLIVLYTGTPTAGRALEMALRLARRTPERLRVAVWNGGDSALDLDLLEQAARRLLESGAAVGEALPPVMRVGATDLPAALRDLGGGTLVVPREQAALVAEHGRSAMIVP